MKKAMPIAVPPESQKVEWKKSLGEWKEIVETCAALASAGSGRIWIGIAPDGHAVGVQVGKGTMEDLANKIAQNTSPRQTPAISTAVHDGKTLIVVDVTESRVKPVYAFDRPYRRTGRTNQRLSQEDAFQLYAASRGITWDSTILEDTSPDDVDPQAVRHFLQTARDERRWDVSPETPVEQVLSQLGLLHGGKLNVAGLLLFGRNPQRLMTQATLRCARFKGTTEVHFIDMEAIQGTVIEQVRQAMFFVKRNIRMGVEIHELQREDVWEYPLDALREAVTNAVCHREYGSTANVQIRIFDDRLEIWNPGGLPEGMTVADLWRKHESRPRNRLLAQAFFLIKYVEQFGTGIKRILDDCHAQNAPEPVFEAERQTFRVVFTPKKAGGTAQDGMALNERQTKALEFIQKHGRIQTGEYRKVVGIKQRQAVKDLNQMMKQGIIVRTGDGRSTAYVLPKDRVHD